MEFDTNEINYLIENIKFKTVKELSKDLKRRM